MMETVWKLLKKTEVESPFVPAKLPPKGYEITLSDRNIYSRDEWLRKDL